MWETAFSTCGNAVSEALLRGRILSSSTASFERVSAALAVRGVLRRKSGARTWLFLAPHASESTARCLVAGLLIGNFGHMHGQAHLPPAEVGYLFEGDLLFVTPAVRPAVEALTDLRLAPYVALNEMWEVATLSQYRRPQKRGKPRIYVTNPGWAIEKGRNVAFGALVIDATQPRTLTRLQELLQIGSVASTPRIAVLPPVEKFMLTRLGYPASAIVWLWDPQSRRICEQVLGKASSGALPELERTLWLCDEDPELDRALQEAHDCCVQALNDSKGLGIPGLWSAWHIINCLRQITVPLTALEEEATHEWAGTLSSQIARLEQIEGYGNPLWELTWPRIVERVKHAYQLLLGRAEPAKFWVLANRLEDWLRHGERSDTLRIVVTNQAEAKRLLQMLTIVVDRTLDAVGNDRLAILSMAEEARRAAAGSHSRTMLSGCRSQRYRYLDLYPERPVEELVYPFEAEIECARQQRLYGFMSELEDDGKRVDLLRTLGFRVAVSGSLARPARSMKIVVLRGNGKAVQLAVGANVRASLDIEELAQSRAAASIDLSDEAAPSRSTGDLADVGAVEVHFAEGGSRRYPQNFKVDVYFPASEEMQRLPAQRLEVGHRVVSFVDGHYEGLFARLRDTVYQKLPDAQRMRLELWHEAKGLLSNRFEVDRAQVYLQLKADGLKAELAAVASWLRDDDDVLAPQHIDDFVVVAKATGCFPNNAMTRGVYAAIQQERGRNRHIGRALRALLRAIVSGAGYEESLDSASQMDSALSDVLGAVELLEVTRVTARPA